MRSRHAGRWLLVSGAVLVLAALALAYAWPPLVRHVVLAQLRAATHRPVTLEMVSLDPFAGRLLLRGLTVHDRDGGPALTDFERLEIRFRPLSLLAGHLWLREVRLEGSNVRIVRLADGFNISDLMEGGEGSGRRMDVTVDHLVVTRSAATLEDRALAEPRTWASEQIEIEAHDLSTRRDDGRAVARSVTVGAPVTMELRRMRLYPIHLEATVTTSNLDLSLARLYLPRDAALTLESGRATSTMNVTLDARAGVRANARSEITDAVLVKRGERDPSLRVPRLTMALSDLEYRDDQLAVGRFDLAGEASVKDPTARAGGRFQLSSVQASLADVTWPVVRPGQLDVRSSVPGGGRLELTGRLSPPPAASQLRLRLARVDLQPWARLAPGTLDVQGFAEADLRIDEPLAPAVPHSTQGAIAVQRARVADAGAEMFRAERVEARGIEVDWPTRLATRELIVTQPRGRLERDATGALVVPGVPVRTTGSAPADTKGPASESSGPAPPRLALAVGALIVRDGAFAWRDQAVGPPVALDVAGIAARVGGVAWPLEGPLDVKASLRPPGGGTAGFDGRVTIQPFSLDGRARAEGAAIGPYLAYAALPARAAGRADFDLAVAVAMEPALRVTARGRAGASSVDVRDEERTLLRIDRADASGLDVDWPGRLSIRDVTLRRPWVLIEREGSNDLSLRAALTPRRARNAGAPQERPADAPPDAAEPSPLAITVRQLVVEDGGTRTVDQRVSPPFALDAHGLHGRVQGLSTDPAAPPARVELAGRVGGEGALAVRGSVGSLGGPLRLDLGAELRDFAVPRTNPYLLQQVAWEARSGSLTTTVQCRLDGSAIEAKSDTVIRRLEVARGPGSENGQARLGLPLGTIVALMKDRRGDIHVSLPVGGRLTDPRFDLSEVLWSTLRNVAVKTITAPVSWIGRVHTRPDSTIERVEVNPVRFAPGSATLSPDAQEQVTRLATFLKQVPDIRLGLTALVSAEDRAAGDAKALTKLATQRLEGVRDGIKKAGADGDRVKLGAPSPTEATEGQVAVEVLEPESRPPGLLRRLLGHAETEAERG